MAEIDGLVGIYGAVDDVVQEDEVARAAVARLLPNYLDPELEWYREFESWLNGTGAKPIEGRERLFPLLPEALNELREIEPRCRMRPRRLFAIAVAMRAFPEMTGPDTELGQLTVGALRVSELAGTEEKARSLQELLADDSFLPGSAPRGTEHLADWWDTLISTAEGEGVIPTTKGMRPRPCSGRLVKVPGVLGPVAALMTEYETDEVGFEQATAFIEPVNWKQCMPNFWCVMKELGPGVKAGTHRYREVVSSDCGSRTKAAFTAETELDFSFMSIPAPPNAEVAITNYELSAGRPLVGDRIRVDEGSLVVAKTASDPGPLRITTTKRIQFSYPFSSQALAMIMCALGYADVAGELLCCAASIPKGAKGKDAGTEFPGQPPPRARRRRPPTGAANVAGLAPGKVMRDVANLWAGVLRRGAEAIEVGVRASRAGTRTGTCDRSEG